MTNVCRHYLISGKVQGVYFRQSTLEKALRLQITGWIRNCEDGRVEIMACGLPENINQFQEWLAQGPPAAKVTDVIAEDREFMESTQFTIHR